MARFVGTWTYDTTNSEPESVKVMRLDVRDSAGLGWGSAVSLGWTPYLQVKKAGAAALVATITGAWEDATETAALFDIGAAGLQPAADAGPIDYEGMLVLAKSGHESIQPDDLSEPYTFRVQRWP
jgi:hypothetical protein